MAQIASDEYWRDEDLRLRLRVVSRKRQTQFKPNEVEFVDEVCRSCGGLTERQRYVAKELLARFERYQ
jgi:hypothetical protein